MKKVLWALLFGIFLLYCPETAAAQPEPTRQVDLFPKPGVDFRRYKSVSEEPSVSIKPDSSWSVDRVDPFLRQRIREMILQSARKQGFVTVDPVDASLTVKVTVTQWGRFRNSQDLNLMEYLALEVNVKDAVSAELILRANAKYSRVDPPEDSMDKMNEAFASIMEEILGFLRAKPETTVGNTQ